MIMFEGICRRTGPLSAFAVEAASYQLPSEAGYQEVWDLDPNMNRVVANHHDPPLLEPSGCMPRIQSTQDQTRTNEHKQCWLALFSRNPRYSQSYLLVDNGTGSSQVGRLRVHPAVALAAAAGGELLEFG